MNAGGMFAGEIGRWPGSTVPIVPMAHEYLITKPLGHPLGHADHARPVAARVLPARRRRAGGRRVRTEPRAVGARRHPARTSTRSCWPRTGTGSRRSWRTPCGGFPIAGGRRGREADQRARGVHARRRVHPRGDRRARVLGRGRVLRARARRGRGAWGSSWPSGSSRGSRRSTCGTWTRGGSGGTTPGCEYTLARTVEVYSTYYDVRYPGQERLAGRPLRVSPTYARLDVAGGVAGARSPGGSARTGSSRTPPRGDPVAPAARVGRARSGRRPIGAEHLACRERAALFDETSFAKIEVSGPGAEAFLQRLCANDVDRPVGTVTYTSMLNERGGIECDFTVTRVEEDRFRIVTGTAFGQHDLAWIRSHAPDDGSVHGRGRDLGVGVPRAVGACRPRRAAAAGRRRTCRTRRSGTCGPASWRSGPVPCLALRVTYVGELGWELYCPMEFGLRLWDMLWEAGPAARAGGRRVPGDRLDAAGEGVPGVGRRTSRRT